MEEVNWLQQGENTNVEMVRQGSLSCLGHVLRRSDVECIKQAWIFKAEGTRARGRQKLSWARIMKN